MFVPHKIKTNKQTKNDPKDQQVSEWNHVWKTGMTKVHTLKKTSVNRQRRSSVLSWLNTTSYSIDRRATSEGRGEVSPALFWK